MSPAILRTCLMAAVAVVCCGCDGDMLFVAENATASPYLIRATNRLYDTGGEEVSVLALPPQARVVIGRLPFSAGQPTLEKVEVLTPACSVVFSTPVSGYLNGATIHVEDGGAVNVQGGNPQGAAAALATHLCGT